MKQLMKNPLYRVLLGGAVVLAVLLVIVLLVKPGSDSDAAAPQTLQSTAQDVGGVRVSPEDLPVSTLSVTTADYQAAFAKLVKDALGEEAGEVDWLETTTEGSDALLLAGNLWGNPCLVRDGDHVSTIIVGITVDADNYATSATLFRMVSLISGAAVLTANGADTDAALNEFGNGLVELMTATGENASTTLMNICGINATTTIDASEEAGMTMLLFLDLKVPQAAE